MKTVCGHINQAQVERHNITMQKLKIVPALITCSFSSHCGIGLLCVTSVMRIIVYLTSVPR